MRRFTLMFSGALVAAAAFAGVSPANASASPACVPAGQATYTHTFNGPAGTATITAVNPLCDGESQAFSIVSYTAPGATGAYPQFVYDVDHATIDAGHRRVTLKVDVPGCFTQVDTIFGSGVLNELTSDATVYGDTKAGSPSGVGSRSEGAAAWYDGGSAACVTEPVVTFASGCDGSFSATVSNNAAAGADAVFVTGGRRVRVAPGGSAVVTGRDKGTLTIRDDTFTTHVSTWQQPSTVCTTAPATTPATATPSPATPRTAPATPATAAPTTAPATTEPAAVTPVASGFVSPAVALPAGPSATLPTTGSNLTSFFLIALGLILAGGGLIFLGRSVYRARHAAQATGHAT